MTTLDDDIIEYSKNLEMLNKENLALKKVLRRYWLYGTTGQWSNLDDCDLTAQVHTAEDMFEKLFSTLQVPAFVGELVLDDNDTPIDFVFTKINKQFASYFHLEPKDIVGKSNLSVNLLKSKAWIDAIISVSNTLETKEMQIMEGDDTFNASFFSSIHGSFVAHFAVPSVIAKEKNQEALQHLKFTQMMVNAIPTPLFYKDIDGRYLLCNKSYAKSIIGVPPETIIGKTAYQLENIFPKQYADIYKEMDSRLIKEKGIQTFEGPFKCADGIVREYVVNKTLISDESGEFVGILGVMQDIDRLLKTRRELAESENRYKTLFNGISQPIIVVDIDGNIIMLNTSAVELFEEDEKHLMDKGHQTIPALGLVNMEYIKHVYATGHPITQRVQLSIGGQERWYLSTMQLIDDFFGEKVVQIISNDITEIKHYQSELLEEKQRAEESNNLKTAFLANIAHETRTPASMITGLIQLMQAGIHKERHPEYLVSIYRNCKKLLDIIDDIVELSKIETGQIKLRHEICSINSIVEEAFVYLQDTLQESGKKIALSRTAPIDEYKSLIYADSQYINQVLRKLISNAVTFTQQGRIEIGVKIVGNTLTFYVKDTGIGIPQDKLQLIFEKFRQGDEGASRQYGGNGLGLSIANELVKSMNGTIHVESTEYQGSTFSFSIQYERAGL